MGGHFVARRPLKRRTAKSLSPAVLPASRADSGGAVPRSSSRGPSVGVRRRPCRPWAREPPEAPPSAAAVGRCDGPSAGLAGSSLSAPRAVRRPGSARTAWETRSATSARDRRARRAAQAPLANPPPRPRPHAPRGLTGSGGPRGLRSPSSSSPRDTPGPGSRVPGHVLSVGPSRASLGPVSTRGKSRPRLDLRGGKWRRAPAGRRAAARECVGSGVGGRRPPPQPRSLQGGPTLHADAAGPRGARPRTQRPGAPAATSPLPFLKVQVLRFRAPPSEFLGSSRLLRVTSLGS